MTSIAFVSTQGGARWGGSEHLWVEVAARLAARGHQVTACVRKWPQLDPRIDALRECGVRLTTWPAPTFLRSVLRKLMIDQTAMDVGRFDVLVVSSGGSTDLLGNKRLQVTVRRVLAANAPLVLAVHGNGNFFLSEAQRAMLQGFYAHTSALVLPAARMREELEQFLALPLPQSVEIPTQTPFVEMPTLPYPTSTALRLATVGRLYTPEKGQDILLAALSRVSWRDQSWTLDIYGDGPDYEYLRALVKMYGLGERVRIRGHADDVRAIWSDHHVLLMPSRLEARGIAITEAMACGRAVVASAIGGIPDTVFDGSSGLLAQAATVDAWVATLELLWQQRERLADWGREGRARIEAVFNVDVVDCFADVVVAAAGNNRSRVGTPAVSTSPYRASA